MITLSKILVATDFSEPAQVALRYGVALAKQFKARLFVLHVVDFPVVQPYASLPVTHDPGPVLMTLEEDARASLQAALPEPDRSVTRAEFHVDVTNSPAQAILRYARENQVDLIIVGSHGRRGLERVLLGTVARHVSESAHCPVLTVRAHERDFVEQIADEPAAVATATV